jgi:hypothetical protein
MTGTKETQEILKFAIVLANAVGKSVEDGEISFFDLKNFLGVFDTAGAAFENFSGAIEELKDLDREELDTLLDQIKEDFDLDNDDLEKKIEAGFDVLGQMYDIYDLVKDYFKKDD